MFLAHTHVDRDAWGFNASRVLASSCCGELCWWRVGTEREGIHLRKQQQVRCLCETYITEQQRMFSL